MIYNYFSIVFLNNNFNGVKNIKSKIVNDSDCTVIRRIDGGLRKKGYYKKAYNDKPLVSVITVVFNGDNFLEECIHSVLNQTYDNFEYIIIDGGSTDKTLEIIKKFDGIIDYWSSESDHGIYDAWNKGIKYSNGEIIVLLNSDDYFYDKNVINTIINLYVSLEVDKRDLCLIHGDMCRQFENGKVKRVKRTKNIYKGIWINFGAVFIVRKIFDTIGLFNNQYKIAGDYDFLLRAKLNNVFFIKIDEFLSVFRIGGVSSSNVLTGYREVLSIQIMQLNNSIKPIIYFFIKFLKYIVTNTIRQSKIFNSIVLFNHLPKNKKNA